YGKVAVKRADSPIEPDTWFTLEIIAQGNRIRILVDGKQTADYTESHPDARTKGCIALQYWKSTAAFRKIEIREEK
ncbi:MAG: DUF1080 domain-containing protein, partial [Gemmataceae bacterium]